MSSTKAFTLHSKRTILARGLKSAARVAGEGGSDVLDDGEGGAVFRVTGHSVEEDSLRRAITYC